ncbi:MAG: aminotransferase class I/II-fold pyridoxal phosphate-dependent enzyme [Gemmatimonadota bacterium]
MDDATWRVGSERLAPFLGERGKMARMPEGIRVWGERAARAGALDATMGVITAPRAMLDRREPGEIEPAEEEARGILGGEYGIAYLAQVRDAFAAWEPLAVFPYAPVAGTRAFREGWRRWIGGKAAGGDFARPAPIAERLTLPVATAGVTGALCATGLLVLDPGDRVLVPDRHWDGYDTTLGGVCGARVELVRLFDGDGWAIDAWRTAIEETARSQARVVLVLNFPHNPTGFVPSEEEAEAFAVLTAESAERSGKPIVVVCDDAYEGYVYPDDRPRWSIFYRLVDRHPRLLPIKCDAITKELLFWGGRLGAISTVLPEAWGAVREAAAAVWENKLSGLVRGMISSASTPVQTLVARLLEDPVALARAREPIFRSLAGRHAAFSEALLSNGARQAFRADPFHGGLFALLNLQRGEAVPAAERLLADRKIGVVPFHNPNHDLNALRVTYATVPRERIEDLVAAAVEVVRSV